MDTRVIGKHSMLELSHTAIHVAVFARKASIIDDRGMNVTFCIARKIGLKKTAVKPTVL